MPTTIVHLACQFESLSGLPEDRYVNTFTAQSTTLGAGAIVAQFGSQLESFYNDAGTGTPTAARLSTAIDRNVDALVLGYDITTHLDGSAAGPPVDAGYSFTLGDPGAGSTLDLPNECAVVLSFHGAGSFAEGPPEGPRPAERHRGRIYLGPLNDLATQAPTADPDTGDMLVSAPFRVHLAEMAVSALMSTAGGVTWCVWSRANAAVYPVSGGFIDNAFDTQRRRGSDATTRTSW